MNICSFEKTIEMISSSKHASLADYYFGLLENLNADSKLDLISKLSQSLKKDELAVNTPLKALFGAYKSEESAEEIIASIRPDTITSK